MFVAKVFFLVFLAMVEFGKSFILFIHNVFLAGPAVVKDTGGDFNGTDFTIVAEPESLCVLPADNIASVANEADFLAVGVAGVLDDVGVGVEVDELIDQSIDGGVIFHLSYARSDEVKILFMNRFIRLDVMAKFSSAVLQSDVHLLGENFAFFDHIRVPEGFCQDKFVPGKFPLKGLPSAVVIFQRGIGETHVDDHFIAEGSDTFYALDKGVSQQNGIFDEGDSGYFDHDP